MADDMEVFLRRWERRLLIQKFCFKAAPFVIGLIVAALVLALHLMMNNLVLAWGLPAALLLVVIHLLHLPQLQDAHQRRRERMAMTETINRRFETQSQMLDRLREIHCRTQRLHQETERLGLKLTRPE